jgi:L-2-hydroxyglutarate oxidase
MYDVAVIGGGIVGLATVLKLATNYPHRQILLIEKEQHLAAHQTGHNSGVIHSGIYYKPDSFKAQFAREGNRSMVAFCQEHGIEHDICGKVIVATSEEELPRLEALYQRGLANQLPVRKLSREALKEVEPHVYGLAAIHVPSTGIVNYSQVAETYARIAKEHGCDIQLGKKVVNIHQRSDGATIETEREVFHAHFVINCSGLHSDRVAKLGDIQTNLKIIPFRGEYYELKPEKRNLVKNLIYPVPNPEFPFLGVHFTRMIDGSVHAGPNAVLSFKREGYRKTDIDLHDTFDTLTYPAFWKLARKHSREGLKEMYRSLSKRAFVQSMQRLIPEITSKDVVPTHAGVRAQALMDDGTLLDDFLILSGHHAIHVCNAPSPAATASLEIGNAIVQHEALLSYLEARIIA